MAFVPGYKKDIFISYAHVDNEQFERGQSGWVSTLFENLGKLLRSKLGDGSVELWMDHHELVGNKPLTRQIMEALEGTAILLVVVSEGYLKSAWCKDERVKFLIKKRTGSDSLVFLVEFDKVERTKFPDEFGELTPYPFWAPHKETGDPQTLGWPKPDDDKDYYQQLNRLCIAVKKELTRLREEAEQQQAQAQAMAEAMQEGGTEVAEQLAAVPAPEEVPQSEREGDAATKTAVYLAEVSDDLNLRREEVRDYLTDKGFTVLPDTWQSYETLDAFEAALDSGLSRCEVFAQLLSEYPGEAEPFGQKLSYPRLQYEHAAGAGKVILQWRDPKLDVKAVADEDQRALLEGPNVLAVVLEEFKRAVEKAAEDSRAAADEKESAPLDEDEFEFVYVYADPLDRLRAQELVMSEAWNKKLGHVLSTSNAGEDSKTVRQFIEFNLLNNNCRAAVIFYGESGPTPVQYQLTQYSRALGSRRTPPLEVAIYDGPPPPQSKHDVTFGFPNLKLRTLNCRDGNQKELSEFLRSVKP